jgi:hypothetical protein
MSDKLQPRRCDPFYQVETTGFSRVEVQFLPILRPKLKDHATEVGGFLKSLAASVK